MLTSIFRVVFDCNIFVQALLNRNGIAAQCWRLVRAGDVRLFASKDTLAEVREVMQRPHILARLPDATAEQIEIFVKDIENHSTYLRFVPEKFKLARDPKDEMIVNLAAYCKAEYIVSRDKDLLDLMSDFTVEAKEFRQKFRPLKIVEPIEFLRIVKEYEFYLNR